MPFLTRLAAAAALACTAFVTVQAQTAMPATLAGHAVLPAQSFVAAPQEARADLQTSGKFTTLQRIDQIGVLQGQSGGRPTGVSLPFQGQPLQGHSHNTNHLGSSATPLRTGCINQPPMCLAS